MIYQTQTVIQMTPEELTQLLDERLAKALASFVPPPPVGVDLPELMTRKDVAVYLRISMTSLSVWSKDTDERKAILIPLTINGRIRYRREDVLAVQKEHRRFQNADRS